MVSRLVTDGSVRGAGLALLGRAVRTAVSLGREPVLLVTPDADGGGSTCGTGGGKSAPPGSSGGSTATMRC